MFVFHQKRLHHSTFQYTLNQLIQTTDMLKDLEIRNWRSSHYAVMHMRNNGSKFFPLREVSILKGDAIEENHCLAQ